MPSIKYMNQSAPFWDFVANIEEQGAEHPFFNRNNRGEGNTSSSDEEGPSSQWGFGFPFCSPPPHHHNGWDALWACNPFAEGPPHPLRPMHPMHPPQTHDEKHADKDLEDQPPNYEHPGKEPKDHKEPGREPGKEKHGCGHGHGPEHHPGHGHGHDHHGHGHGGHGHGHDHHGHGHGGPGHGHGGPGRRGGPWGRCGRGVPSGGRGWGRRGHHGPGPWNLGALGELLQSQMFGNGNSDGEKAQDFKPEIDVFDTETAFVIHMSVPGAKKEDVAVNWNTEKSELEVSGVTFRHGDEEFLKTLAMDERKVGAFERKVRLGSRAQPAQVDVEAIGAKLEDGILIITVPKLDKDYVEIKKVDIE